MQGLRELFGSGNSLIFVQDTGTGEIPLWLGLATEDTEDEYRRHIHSINPRAHFGMARRPGTLVWDYRVLPESGMDRHPFYDWLRRETGFRYFIGCRMFEEGPYSAFASLDWPESHGHASEEEAKLFSRMLPHIEQALRLTMAARLEKARATALETAIHCLDCGVIVLDRQGRAVFVSAPAEKMLMRNDGLAIRDGRLRAFKAADERALGLMVAAALAASGGQAFPEAHTRPLSRQGPGPPYVVSVLPVATEPLATLAGEAAVLVVIRDSFAHGADTSLMRKIYGLTEREAELAALLQEGADPGGAADRLRISVNTARVHLKAIFIKTGVRSQAELARLLSALPRA